MTKDEVCALFNSNPCLTLPIIVETGSSVQGELEKRWDSFFEFLHRTEALYSCIEPAEYSREKITDAFKSYYAGDFGKASENLFDIVKTLIDKYRCKKLITDISSLYSSWDMLFEDKALFIHTKFKSRWDMRFTLYPHQI